MGQLAVSGSQRHPSTAWLPPEAKNSRSLTRPAAFYAFAEAEGFEPPVPCGTTVFKTAAIDHSAIPPKNSPRILFGNGVAKI